MLTRMKRRGGNFSAQSAKTHVHLDPAMGIVADSELTTELWQYGRS